MNSLAKCHSHHVVRHCFRASSASQPCHQIRPVAHQPQSIFHATYGLLRSQEPIHRYRALGRILFPKPSAPERRGLGELAKAKVQMGTSHASALLR